MLIKTEAIVLHSLKYGESQLIVDMLTEYCGRLSFIVRRGISRRSGMKVQFFQPLTILEISFDYRQNGRLQKLKDVRIVSPLASIPFDPYKLSISLFLAEFLYHATRSEENNPFLFKYVVASVMWLDGAKERFASFHLVFMMRLCKFVGFQPNLNSYSEGDVFDLRTGCFESQVPLHAEFVSPSDAAKICNLMRMNYDSMRLFSMSHDERNRCTDIIIMYYRLHVPSFPELKSLSVLRDLFG